MHQTRGMLRGGWASAGSVEELADPEAVVVLTGPCLFWSLQPEHTVGACSRWASGGGRWTGSLEPRPVHR
jgi:hypothetical protein